MMLKEMLKSCKKNKTIIIDYFGEQKFLSDGYTMICMDAVAPEWTDEDCAVYLELSEEDRESYVMKNIDIIDEKTKLRIKEYISAEKLRFSLNLDGLPVQPFKLQGGELVFCDMTKLRIFKNEHPKVYYFSDERKPKMYISVNGVVIGSVTPLKVSYDTMKDFCRELFQGVTKSEERGLLCENEQMSLI